MPKRRRARKRHVLPVCFTFSYIRSCRDGEKQHSGVRKRKPFEKSDSRSDVFYASLMVSVICRLHPRRIALITERTPGHALLREYRVFVDAPVSPGRRQASTARRYRARGKEATGRPIKNARIPFYHAYGVANNSALCSNLVRVINDDTYLHVYVRVRTSLAVYYVRFTR